MALNERPGVYTSYEVSSALAGSGAGTTVAVVAKAYTGAKGSCITISSLAHAVSVYGDNSNITDLIRILLLNGASAIRAVAVANSSDENGYKAAFELLYDYDDISIIICDCHNLPILATMRDCILNAPENSKYRIGIAETSGTPSEIADTAENLNCERMVLVGPTDSVSIPGSAAAAAAAQIASSSDPAIPLNGAQLFGLSMLTHALTDQDINALVRAGVTPLENVGSSTYIIRGITTRTKTGGSPDATWKEITTIRIVDDVITSVKSALRSRFSRAKNTLQTRGAIKTQVVIELENKKNREIIDSYDNITVTPNADDPTICEVRFEFTVAHGLNQIHLSAHITV